MFALYNEKEYLFFKKLAYIILYDELYYYEFYRTKEVKRIINYSKILKLFLDFKQIFTFKDLSQNISLEIKEIYFRNEKEDW